MDRRWDISFWLHKDASHANRKPTLITLAISRLLTFWSVSRMISCESAVQQAALIHTGFSGAAISHFVIEELHFQLKSRHVARGFHETIGSAYAIVEAWLASSAVQALRKHHDLTR